MAQSADVNTLLSALTLHPSVDANELGSDFSGLHITQRPLCWYCSLETLMITCYDKCTFCRTLFVLCVSCTRTTTYPRLCKRC